MTNELEKQFFDTFGIEPKYKCTTDGNCYFQECSKCCWGRCTYPQITDSILLELICLCPDLDDVFFTDVEKLKETLLNSYIKIYKYYTEVERLSDCGKELKHQVRTLFEEGKWK